MIFEEYEKYPLERKAKAVFFFLMSTGFVVSIYIIFLVALKRAGIESLLVYLYSLTLLLITLFVSGYKGDSVIYSILEVKEVFFTKKAIRSYEIDEEVFKASNLSKDDMRYLLKVVNEVEEQLDEIVKVTSSNTNLKEILHSNSSNKLNVINSTLESLLNEPERLNELGNFINVYIPNLLEIVETYNKVDSHFFKDEKGLEVLSESEATIIEICEKIEREYIDFRRKDIDKLQSHIDYTRKRFDRDNQIKNMSN